ncbi:hypothetical protein [Rhizobium leguminosarum]|uniref:hypothetical protein n=1 Tax=Rhizobium leguminosarum TaxID=384 RepID=UPI00143F7E29|nr:hypothetical protein [Rhizobium leguminosarum]NKL18478.1 hypothetical protein [Rhizobium leguminosarum bv. viciae]
MSKEPDFFPKAWPAIKATLAPDASPEQWEAAIGRCLDTRLKLRYFDPIEAITASRKLKGEGFLILTIQCSILEFLASLRRGWNYRQGAGWGIDFEYGGSKRLYVEFLCQNPPFSDWFPTEERAEDFYKNIRCGLVHEAQTKDGWVVKAGSSQHPLIDFNAKIVNRDEFGRAINIYLADYRHALRGDQNLQDAFKRKFDNIYFHATAAPGFASGG